MIGPCENSGLAHSEARPASPNQKIGRVAAMARTNHPRPADATECPDRKGILVLEGSNSKFLPFVGRADTKSPAPASYRGSGVYPTDMSKLPVIGISDPIP